MNENLGYWSKLRKSYGKNKFLYFGIILTIILFLLIEFLSPYFFLKNDNASIFLPVVLEGSSQLFSGHFPGLNTHQLMGSPIMEIGTYSILYPITIISYFLSHYFLGNDFLTFEIFALLHLVFGFLAMYFFIFSKTDDKFVSFIASISFIFSGVSLSLISIWYYVAPILVFLPLILFLNDRLFKGGNKSLVFLGVVRGVYFYTGNAQYFAFTLFFEFIYFLIGNYQKNWKNFCSILTKYLFSLILTFIIIIPLLLSQLSVLVNVPRGDIPFISYITSEPVNPLEFIFGSLLPSFITGFIGLLKNFGPWHSAGSIFFIGFIFLGSRLILKYRKASLKKIDPTFWCGLISGILSFGIIGGIYLIGAVLPVVKNFKGPYKSVVFSVFFITVFGAMAISELIKKRNFGKFKNLFLASLFIIILLVSLGNIIYLMDSSPVGDQPERDTRKSEDYYNKLDLGEGRIVSIITGSDFSPKNKGVERKISAFPEWGLINKDFATYHHLNHFSGYETFQDELTTQKIPINEGGIYDRNLNISAFEEYGVQYIVISREGEQFHPELNGLNEFYSDEYISIFETKNPRGFVFDSESDLDYLLLANGVNFKTNYSEETSVTINFLCKKNYVYNINEKVGEISCDNFGRMKLLVPSGNKEISVIYVSKEFYRGILFSIILIIVFILILYKRKKIEGWLYNLGGSIFGGKWGEILNKKLWIFVILMLFFGFLIFIQMTNSKNVEIFIESRTGLEAEVGKMSINPFTGRIILRDVNLYRIEEKIFYSEEINLDLEYIYSLKSTFTKRNPQIFLTATLSEASFFVKIQNSEEKDCEGGTLGLSYPKESFLDYEELKLGEEFVTKIRFVPFSKAFFDFPEKIFLKDNDEILIKGDIKFERYVSGEIIIYKDTELNENVLKKSCILFPLEERSPLFIE